MKFKRVWKSKIANREAGQAMVEFALILPFLLMVICFIIDFGWIFACKNELTNLAGQTARDAAIHASEGSASVKTREETLLRNTARYGVPDITVTLGGTTGYATVTLTHSTRYLTGFTGILTGEGNDVTLTAKAAAPIDVYNAASPSS